jgi:CBS domain-containing protein
MEEALRRMQKAQVRRILVADPSNKLLGIITVSDVISRMKDPAKTNQLVSELSCSH